VPVGPSWRERWRSVYLHLVVPPIGCQALLDSLPAAVAPRIREFKLAGTFSTDVKVWVDFAKLMKLPPLGDPNSPDPQLTAEEEVNELAAILPPAAVAASRNKAKTPPGPPGAQVKDPRDDPVPARVPEDLVPEIDQEEQPEAEADRTAATGRSASLPVGGETEDRVHHD
jgi:hypothetical protein